MILVDRAKVIEHTQGCDLELPSMTEFALRGFIASQTSLMPEELFGALVADLKVNPRDILPGPETTETKPQSAWSADIEVDGDRLKMTVYHDGEEVVYGKSYVQESDDLGMMQAISYAAHMCYKMVQQRSM